MLAKYNHLIRNFILIMMIWCCHNLSFAYITVPGTVPTPGLSVITEGDFSVVKGSGLSWYVDRSERIFTYKINSDSLSVGMISAYCRTRAGKITTVTAPPMDSVVTRSSDGKEYILTSLGNNCTPLLINNFTITPNIRRLEAYALTYELINSDTQYYSYENRYMDENTEFDYVGMGSLHLVKGSTLKIADNGELHTIRYVPPIIKLGKNVKLKSVEYVFCSFSSDSVCQVYSYSENPPQIETYRQILPENAEQYTPEPKAELFSKDKYYTADYSTLYVPAGCKEAYSADPEWGRFENIVEMEPVALEEIIADEEQGISISTDHGQIYVKSTEDREVLVFAMSGLLLKRDHTRDGGVSITLQPGAYLVKVGDKFIRKVAVK